MNPISKMIMILMIMPSFALSRGQRNKPINATPIFLASIPKCGSHLIKKCLSLMGHRSFRYPSCSFFNAVESDFSRNANIFSHAPFNPALGALIQNKNYRGIFMMRDPRDQAVSFIHFAQKNIKLWPTIRSLSFQDALTRWISDAKIIKGSGKFSDPIMDTFGTIASFYDHYLPWIDHPNFYMVRFEHLIGSQGGGSDELQRQEIINIAQHLGANPTDDLIDKTVKNLFGRSRTFRKGQIGSWKQHFTDEHKALFKEVAGDLLIHLGYEQDYNW